MRDRRLDARNAAAARTASRSTRTRRTSRAARRTWRRRSACRSPTCASSSTRARARSATAGTRSTSPRRRRCMSREAGVPVRLQLMRWDEQGWTRYGQAFLTDLQGGVDGSGNIVAYQATQTTQPSTSLFATGQLAFGLEPPALGAGSPEHREPRAVLQGRDRDDRLGLPGDRQDDHAAARRLPVGHAARAVGAADRVRLRAVHRHARRAGGDGSARVPAAEPAHRRPVPALGDGAADRRRRSPATRRTSPPRSRRPGQHGHGLGDGDRHAQRLVRRHGREGAGRQEDRQGRRSRSSGRRRTRA